MIAAFVHLPATVTVTHSRSGVAARSNQALFEAILQFLQGGFTPTPPPSATAAGNRRVVKLSTTLFWRFGVQELGRSHYLCQIREGTRDRNKLA